MRAACFVLGLVVPVTRGRLRCSPANRHDRGSVPGDLAEQTCNPTPSDLAGLGSPVGTPPPSASRPTGVQVDSLVDIVLTRSHVLVPLVGLLRCVTLLAFRHLLNCFSLAAPLVRILALPRFRRQ